jgi:hypothetical protein
MRYHLARLALATTLAASALSALAPAASAARGTCHVADLRAGTSSAGAGGNLQRAIDAADPGSTLRVTGRCVGSFAIDKRLTVRGRSTDRFARPTLAGDGTGSVLLVRARTVTLENVRLTGGDARSGGGIYNDGGDLTLLGVTVTGNSAGTSGGGIVNDHGRLRLNGGTVAGNEAVTVGGGIFNYRGTLTVNGDARVRNNTVGRHGGGIYNYGTLTVNGSSSVTDNDAGRDGGGIFDIGSVTLNDTVAVTGNSAGIEGGGVFLVQGHVHVCSGGVVLSPNTPDDPPATDPCR